MKASTYSILFSLLVLLLFATCTEKEADNPFDADCPKDIFTPANFKSEMSGTSVKLTWSQQNMTINGFVINRSENGGSATEVARVNKSVTTWTDMKVAGGTKYDYTIYAYAGANLSNSLNISITTPALSPTVTTVSIATTITHNSVVLGGNVTGDGGATVTERGICYATTQNPTTTNNKVAMGSGKGEFSGTLPNLVSNTTYYAKAYAVNSFGIAYGTEISFTTMQLALPTVTTIDFAGLNYNSVTLGCYLITNGGAAVTEKGVCYATIQNPTIANSKISLGSSIGTTTNIVNGLSEGTTYYARAYAINSVGTSYGQQISFTTPQLMLPTISTADATNVTGTTVILGGNVTNDGNTTVTERGVCYATTQAPATSGTKIVIGTGTGTFSNTVIGLADGTKYYARAYAINNKGTAYGNEISFTTNTISLATITTSTASNVGSTSVTLGGSISSDGNATVTERGVCYAITQNPTIGNNKLAIGTGTGTFSNTVSGLAGNTTYYARAYAINSIGTAYGNEVSFKTSITISLASVTTNTPGNITINSALLGGNITDDGKAEVIERGICFNTSGLPTISSGKVVIGNGTGSFSNTITGFSPNTTYYVRAYATNSVGTAYGNQLSFVSLGNVPTVSTKDATNILETSAIVGGIVLSDEGSTVIERGVCYGIATDPTIYDTKLASGSGTGGFNIPLNTLVPNTTYYTRAYATNKNGTAYGENKTFKAADAYYAGFENGWPTGWKGNWSISSDSPYEGFNCLKSTDAGQTVELSLNITNTNGGQISFFHKSDGGCDQMGFSCRDITTEFYIDDILQATIIDEGWTLKAFSVMSGTHTFKWINKGGGYSGKATYIDYVICPK